MAFWAGYPGSMQRPDGADHDYWTGLHTPQRQNPDPFRDFVPPVQPPIPGWHPWTPATSIPITIHNQPGVFTWVTPQNPNVNLPPENVNWNPLAANQAANVATFTPHPINPVPLPVEWHAHTPFPSRESIPLPAAPQMQFVPAPAPAPPPAPSPAPPPVPPPAPPPAYNDPQSIMKYLPHLHPNDKHLRHRESQRIKPLNWRPDFKPTICNRITSTLAYAPCSNRLRLVPYLKYKSPPNHRLIWDLRSYPLDDCSVMTRSHVVLTMAELYRPATEPPTKKMQIYHDRLPWYIDIRASQKGGITVRDVIQQIADFLHHVVLDSDYGMDLFTRPEKMAILNGAQMRTGSTQAGIATRVDFLLHEYMFLGLVKDKQGRWKMKTTAESGFLHH